MKLLPYPNHARQPKRTPLKTALELAEQLKVTMAQLRGHLAKEGAPKPDVWHRSSGAHYEPKAFVQWWNRKK